MWSGLETPSERTVVEYEDRQQTVLSQSPDVAEAITAFLEKRPAQFAD